MGITQTSVRLANPTFPDRSIEVNMIVDSGAIFSVVPATLLKQIGIAPRGYETFELANAHSVRRGIGDALYDIEGRVGAAPVVFGRRGDACLLGAVTLEALGLRLDPLRRQLRPFRSMIA
jgi:predicted aspartyl protease